MNKRELVLNIGAIVLLLSVIALSTLSLMGIIHFVWIYALLVVAALSGMLYTKNDLKELTAK